MNDIMYLIIAIVIVIITLLLYILWYYKHNNIKQEIDYRTLFILGICYLPLGITLKNPGFLVFSLILMGVGIYHKDKWKEQDKNQQLNPKQQKMLIGILLFLGVGLFAGILVFYLFNK